MKVLIMLMLTSSVALAQGDIQREVKNHLIKLHNNGNISDRCLKQLMFTASYEVGVDVSNEHEYFEELDQELRTQINISEMDATAVRTIYAACVYYFMNK